jgi:hypothetical protein
MARAEDAARGNRGARLQRLATEHCQKRSRQNASGWASATRIVKWSAPSTGSKRAGSALSIRAIRDNRVALGDGRRVVVGGIELGTVHSAVQHGAGSGHNSVGGGGRDSLTRDRPQVVDPDAELSHMRPPALANSAQDGSIGRMTIPCSRPKVGRQSSRHGGTGSSNLLSPSDESVANLSFLRLTERPQSHRERSSLTGDRADAEAQA